MDTRVKERERVRESIRVYKVREEEREGERERENGELRLVRGSSRNVCRASYSNP